jgi:hypothetical protein
MLLRRLADLNAKKFFQQRPKGAVSFDPAQLTLTMEGESADAKHELKFMSAKVDDQGRVQKDAAERHFVMGGPDQLVFEIDSGVLSSLVDLLHELRERRLAASGYSATRIRISGEGGKRTVEIVQDEKSGWSFAGAGGAKLAKGSDAASVGLAAQSIEIEKFLDDETARAAVGWQPDPSRDLTIEIALQPKSAAKGEAATSLKATLGAQRLADGYFLRFEPFDGFVGISALARKTAVEQLLEQFNPKETK